jgi:peptidoglycan/LPS O-acetylase OafA/YrhL
MARKFEAVVALYATLTVAVMLWFASPQTTASHGVRTFGLFTVAGATVLAVLAHWEGRRGMYVLAGAALVVGHGAMINNQMGTSAQPLLGVAGVIMGIVVASIGVLREGPRTIERP